MSEPTLHYARTRDGWRLALHHRAPPRGGHATPIVLCHGMGSNRFNMDGPGRASLARHLQRQGYDVWVLGRFAPDEIYPVVTSWLDEHRPAPAERA